MTFGQTIFLSALYQETQVVTFEKVQEPADYSFIWFLGMLAVILFIGFFWWIRRQKAEKKARVPDWTPEDLARAAASALQ